MSAHITKGITLGECPACRKTIHGDVLFDVTLPEDFTVQGRDAATVEATLTAVGCRVNHDCIPRNTRGADRVG